MKIGTYYYPEQWPREQWERDLDKIVEMGLQIVHLAEFAWFEMEPAAGEIKLDWLAEVVEMCKQRNLDVILCTPTAAPPIWLSETAGVLPMRADGSVERHGGRRHYTPTSPAMREASARIVTAMAERFGEHPSVIGWQIDNEYSSGHFDQHDFTHAQFRDWLRARYGDIDGLNKAWHNQFWNTYYTDFEQILLPPDRQTQYGNPHHYLDGSRFWSRAFADFNKLQADILRPRIGERWITTNFMPFSQDCNPADMADSLSLFAWDTYPVSGWGGPKTDENYRLADPEGMEWMHDQMASYTGRWGLLEVQPGTINWSGIPVLLYPGAVRLWLWTAIAHDAEFITVYRFRQPTFGTEQFHHGLVNHDGVTESPGGRQFSQVIEEVRKVAGRSPTADGKGTYKPLFAPAGPTPRERRVGMLFDFEQLWYFTSLPQSKRWNQPRLLTQWHGAASRLGLEVDVLHPDGDWGDPKVIVAPGLQMVDPSTINRLEKFVGDGGHLILTCRSATMDKTGAHWEGKTADPIVGLIGGTIEAYDGLPEHTWALVEMDDVEHKWGVWGDLLYADDATKVIARYGDQFYDGAAAVLQHKVGQGMVTYCGVYDEGSLTRALMEKVARQAGLDVAPTPVRVRCYRRGDLNIVLNYQAEPYDVPAPAGATFLVGKRTLEPAGVAVWRA